MVSFCTIFKKSLILFCFVILHLIFETKCDSRILFPSDCDQINPCQCDFPNGLYIDLSKLSERNWINASLDTLTFYFHPCSNKPLGPQQGNNSGCADGVALCLYNGTALSYTSLGSANETQFAGTQLYQQRLLIFSHGNVTTYISLECDMDSKVDIPTLKVLPVHDSNKFSLSFRSTEVCPKYKSIVKIDNLSEDSSLSTGSILIIILLVLVGTYLLVGMALLKFVHKAQGIEIIPHYEFWSSIPGLVQDGVLFTLNGCRVGADNAYDRI